MTLAILPRGARLRSMAMVLAACLVLALPFLVDEYQTFQFTLVLCYALAILGLNLLTGYSGQLSLGHGAFFALGGYTAAILLAKLQVPYWILPLITGAVGFGFGWLFGFPALRLHGHHLALATFALALAVPQILKHKSIATWTGGVGGLVLSKPSPPSWLALNQDQWLYFYVLAITALGFWLALNLVRSPIGLAVTAMRDHPIAASAMGVDAAHHKTLMFGISAMYTSVAGGLAAIAVQYVAPDSFNIFLSIALLVGVVVGGLGTISGAVFGALFVQFVPNLSDALSKSAPAAIYGILLIAVGLFFTRGFVGLLRTIEAALARRLRPAPAAPPLVADGAEDKLTI